MDKKVINKPLDEKQSWNYLLLLLGRQAYTEKQLYQKLSQKNVDETLINKLILKLQSLNLLDDGLYAKQYIASRKKKKGPQILKRELSQKGVAEELIEQGLSELDDESQFQAVVALLEKHSWQFKGDKFKKRQKAYAFLVRRGFSAGIIAKALEDMW